MAKKPDLVRYGFLLILHVMLLVIPLMARSGVLEKIEKTGVITIGYQVSPPFSYVANDEYPVGYSIDICKKVVEAIKSEVKTQKIDVRYQNITAENRDVAISNGEIDIECSNTPSTKEGSTKVAFTIPTYYAITRMMTRTGSGIKTPYDLKDKVVVTVAGTHAMRVFERMNNDLSLRANHLVVDNFDAALSLMENNSTDALVMDDILLNLIRIASENEARYEISKSVLAVQPISLVFRKDDLELKHLVDNELTRVILKAEVYGIYKKWFESPIPAKQQSQVYRRVGNSSSASKEINLKMQMSQMLRESFRVPTDWVPDSY